ncbi:hypothetical protein DPMN_098092 [Dreissena polymorpha]|uniref:Myb/SANT-like DNA-binding domain-containing protein n=1 Tax=Dreissena polymorpha TaxID=45954 RepID=A0A9D4R5B5_DREPO|nr:hypothetical protein DPMN_098092 [Dreissena polymorpha]
MAEDCGLNGLSNHELLKHRFTEGITSQTKKKMWARVSDLYNVKASKTRSADKLEKKWLNLVAKLHIIYTDYVRDRALTEAIMNVIGIESPSIAGAAGVALDSSFSQLESLSAVAIPSHAQYLEVVAGPSQTTHSDEKTRESSMQPKPTKCSQEELEAQSALHALEKAFSTPTRQKYRHFKASETCTAQTSPNTSTGTVQPKRHKHNPRLRHGQIISPRRPNRVFTRRIAVALGIDPRNDAESVLTTRTFADLSKKGTDPGPDPKDARLKELKTQVNDLESNYSYLQQEYQRLSKTVQYDEAQLQAAVLKRTNVLCKRTKIGSRYRNFVAAKDWYFTDLATILEGLDIVPASCKDGPPDPVIGLPQS